MHAAVNLATTIASEPLLPSGSDPAFDRPLAFFDSAQNGLSAAVDDGRRDPGASSTLPTERERKRMPRRGTAQAGRQPVFVSSC